VIDARSPIVVLGIRAASPLAVLIAVFLFFAGHNRPGGGFAAGLMLGAVIALRTVAGLQKPVPPMLLLGIGAFIAGAVALGPVVAGELLLDQVMVGRELPVLGKVKSGTAAIFDLGVTFIVVGLIFAVLDGLGATRMDRPGSPVDRRPEPTSREASS
jgi:multisubunit Na+/H+ antiporter MnhB subunit